MMMKSNSMGTFVEFGCADGTTHSTTFPFEKMGWKGLCIEPNYPNYLKAKAARKNAIFALVTGKPGKFTYAQMEGPECNQASGIIEFYSPAYHAILKNCEAKGMVKRVPLEGIPLETLLTKHGFTQVDWISVDCEGCEGSFISNFDFTKWGVQMVNYEPNTAARMHTAEIKAAFKKHGFVFDRELQDRIWRKPGPFTLEGRTLSTWNSKRCRMCQCAPHPTHGNRKYCNVEDGSREREECCASCIFEAAVEYGGKCVESALGATPRGGGTRTDPKFILNQRVLCRYQGGADAYPGKVVAVRGDGTFDIAYDDGDVEQSVSALFIRQTQSVVLVGDMP